MIICSQCGKENADNFRFCMGCGANLADAPTLDEGPTEEEPATSKGGVKARGERPIASLTDMAGSIIAEERCPVCGATQKAGFKFCSSCGASLEALTKTGSHRAADPSPPRSGISRGRLGVVRDDGTDDKEHPLDVDGTIIGRTQGQLTFPKDNFLAPEHLELIYRDQVLYVRPMETTNGVFLRIFDECILQDGAILRIGQELLRFELLDHENLHNQSDENGTEALGSELGPKVWGRLVLVVAPREDAAAYLLDRDEVLVGRDRGDIRFPGDGYVSSSHAVFKKTPSGYSLRDLGSSNGTFIRLSEERRLRTGDFLLAGQQLFRLEP